VRWLLRHRSRGYAIVSLDESVFTQDVEARRVWAVEGTRPIRIAVTDTHGRTVLFGAISLDGRQLFRQYKRFDGISFLDYLKKAHRRFRRLYLFMDRAPQHTKTGKVLDYLKAYRTSIRARWFPVGCPEFNVMEECWRQGEKDLSAMPRFPLSLQELKRTLAGYYRTKRFNLDMRKFLLTNRCL
jgi:transposase